MKKFSLLAFITVLCLVFVPVLNVAAEERIAVKFTNGDLYLKEGGIPFSGTWRQLTSGVNVGDVSLAGDYMALVDEGNSQKTVTLKQPAWNSGWNFIDLESTIGGTTKKVAMTKTSDGLYRIVILRSNGSVVMKDGAWNSGFWSGTLEASGVTDIVVGGDNVGIIKSNGDFKAKKLTPGQIGHPNNVSWLLVAQSVTKAAMTQDRVAIVSGGNVQAKEGGVTGAWQNTGLAPGIFSFASSVELSGNRLCAITNPSQLRVECKDGSFLNSGKMVYLDAVDFKISGDRFLALKANGDAEAMKGSLTQNSGWFFVNIGNAAAIEMN